MAATEQRHDDLFPQIASFDEQFVKVSSIHSIFVRQGGATRGVPVLFIHGGPGAGTTPACFRFFDPEFYRVILVDQRGAGRSQPFGDMTDNNTQALIRDFEQVRELLGIKQWLVFGGSWGSTLGLAYAQAVPQHCLGLVLRGIWLARQKEVDFFFKAIGHSFPERAQEFYHFIPPNERHDILQAYYRRLMDPRPEIHLPAAYHFAKYELGSSYHAPQDNLEETLKDTNLTLGLSRTEAHYMMNGMFLRPNQLIAEMAKIQHLPGELVHGRYDAVCPYAGAFELKQHWPQARLTTVPTGGHSAFDPPISRALVAATERFKGLLCSA